jgi:hypothetical protein
VQHRLDQPEAGFQVHGKRAVEIRVGELFEGNDRIDLSEEGR